MSKFVSESSLMHILGSYPDLMVATLKINLAKHLGPMQCIKQIINPSHQIPMLNSNLIQPSVIDTKTERIVFIFFKITDEAKGEKLG